MSKKINLSVVKGSVKKVKRLVPRPSKRLRFPFKKGKKNANHDIVIAVMGVTGVGKSNFISTVTGESNAKVGHDLYSETSEVNSYRFTHNAQNYVLIDTPGFDDTTISNEDVVKKLITWLGSFYRAGTRLNGILYIHNITKPRIQGSAFQNIKMFRALCGPDALQNVILATSFWDQVSPSVGQRREEELVQSREFWADMVAKGAEVVRINPDRAIYLSVVERFAAKNQVNLLVQEELVDKNKKLEDTTAGKTTALNASKQVAKVEKQLTSAREKEKKQLQAQMKAKEKAQDKNLAKLRREQWRRERKQAWDAWWRQFKGDSVLRFQRTEQRLDRFEIYLENKRLAFVERRAESRERRHSQWLADEMATQRRRLDTRRKWH